MRKMIRMKRHVYPDRSTLWVYSRICGGVAEMVVQTRHATLYISRCLELQSRLYVPLRLEHVLALFFSYFFPFYFVQGSIVRSYGSLFPL